MSNIRWNNRYRNLWRQENDSTFKICESNGLYQDGILTDTNGNEEFCFYYKYDHQNNLNKITFWTFQWITSGYTTEEKIGVLKIRGDNQELIIKKGYTLSRDFVKLVTKT